MRVGLFHATLPEPGRKPGGVELLVHRLAQELVSAGHGVTVLSFSDPPARSTYRHRRLRPRGVERSTLARLTTVPVLLNWADTSGLDVLHLHGDDWLYLRRRLPTVRTFHGFALYEAKHGTRLRLRARQLATYPLEVAASRLATASYGVNDRAVAPLYLVHGVLHNGVAMPEAGATSKSETPSILFVGTWEGRKRGRFLRDVFERHVLPSRPTAELWMVSDRCEASPQVRWFEAPPDAELSELFRRAWAFCLPSTYEGFGIPYIEAMAAATPVVATPNPGSRMILENGSCGLLAGDDELGPALLRLLEQPGLRADLVEAGSRRARDFAWDRVVKAHEAAYRSAIEEWRG